MKRIWRVIFIVVAFFSMFSTSVFLGFAESEAPTYRYELTVDGQTEKNVNTGDIITIALYLHRTDASEQYTMYSMQDEIRYDSTFFEFVEGSEMLANGVQTANIAVDERYREVYMNFLSLSGGETWQSKKQIGSFQLRVIAETGVTNITNQDYLVSLSDGSGSYACEVNSLTITVGEVSDSQNEEKPSEGNGFEWEWLLIVLAIFLGIVIILVLLVCLAS